MKNALLFILCFFLWIRAECPDRPFLRNFEAEFPTNGRRMTLGKLASAALSSQYFRSPYTQIAGVNDDAAARRWQRRHAGHPAD